MTEPSSTVVTAYGRLDKVTLEEVQSTYDTSALLRAVDELDGILVAATDHDGLRDMLLRLHSMAHTVINGASMSVTTDRESLPELAADLIAEVQTVISAMQRIIRLVEPLERLEPHH
jgi:hypothetical protein